MGAYQDISVVSGPGANRMSCILRHRSAGVGSQVGFVADRIHTTAKIRVYPKVWSISTIDVESE